MWLLRKIAFPISLVYALVVYFRNYFFEIGLLKSESFDTPTICVGNLSAGGTGKSPMIEFLISILKDDFKIAVLSRGYRRKSKGFILADSESSVEMIGDEPYQIHANFPEVALAVDADRRNGIALLESQVDPDLILLDDAYQHRRVKSDFHILLTVYDHLYCDDWYLPTGNLRDSKGEARRADVIVVTKCSSELSPKAQDTLRRKLKPKVNQDVLFSYLSYSPQISGEGSHLPIIDLKEKKVTLVTGIANPKPLVTFLKEVGIAFEHFSFKDHHFFSKKELELFNTKDLVLTTEKDYVRLKGKVKNLYFIGVKHKFLNEGETMIQERLFNFMKSGS